MIKTKLVFNNEHKRTTKNRSKKMKNRKVVGGKNGFSITEVTETDKDGKIISIIFEVCDPKGVITGPFSTQEKAYQFIENEMNHKPNSSPSM